MYIILKTTNTELLEDIATHVPALSDGCTHVMFPEECYEHIPVDIRTRIYIGIQIGSINDTKISIR